MTEIDRRKVLGAAGAASLAAALPIFEAHLAPLTIRIAGGVCAELRHLPPSPFVELVGWLDDVDGFYRSLEAVLVPMAFSSGLKIKVAEALALDLPVLAHAHAFEGYRVHHPAQALPSFEALAHACVELAYAPEGLATLRDAGIPVALTLAGGYAPTPLRTAELHSYAFDAAARRLRAEQAP